MREKAEKLWKSPGAFIKNSIRRRIMLLFVLIMTLLLLSIWAINNWWLERYYVNQRLLVMEEAYREINELIMEKTASGVSVSTILEREVEHEQELWNRRMTKENEQEEQLTEGEEKGEKQESRKRSQDPSEETTLLGAIRSYGETNNITIVLIDGNTGLITPSVGREGDFLAKKMQGYILGRGTGEAAVLKQSDNYIIETNVDVRSSSKNMESWGFFEDNSTQFIMSMPLASISDSVHLSNRFTTMVGLVVLLFGSVVMYFAINRVTNPLLKLTRLSEQMSKLDFTVSYDGDASDEIGVLGHSMNTLSDKLKEAIGALQEANQQLQHDIEEKIQIDEMRKEFIANVSHELKTPIALIQGYAEGLTEGMCEDEESRNYYCEVIMDEAGKMNKMVKQLLALTALEFGNDEPVMAEFDLSELIRDLISSSAILIQQHEARVDLELPQTLPVIGDEFKIEEVLTNYLTNAMNHLDGERRICIRTEQQPDTVTVFVFNNGKHIPEEDLPNLWTKFFKVDKARTRAYGGSGIGLSIVKAIMDAHHQTCGVANREGGVEFWFTMKKVVDKSEQSE